MVNNLMLPTKQAPVKRTVSKRHCIPIKQPSVGNKEALVSAPLVSLASEQSSKARLEVSSNTESSVEREESTNTIAKQLVSKSPRSHEVQVLSDLISNCFKRFGKMAKTGCEFYKVGKVLGRGAFGKVHLGLHRLTRKLVAIKTLLKQCTNEETEKKKM